MRGAPVLLAIGILVAVLGLALAAGGAWLVGLGGSWYYLVAGAGFLLTAFLLFRRAPAALWVYAVVVVGTLVWALWETGLDWWPLAPRIDVVFLLGLLLLTPWVTRALHADVARVGRPEQAASSPGSSTAPANPVRAPTARERPARITAFRGAGLALTTALAGVAVVAVVSWFVDPHRLEGVAGEARAAASENAFGIAPGEWHAYGRTEFGRRYSPLADVTPQNVSSLEVAWTYRTGDLRGLPGDPEETTFEVTPLKIGSRLFLCTPHQLVIALDATTGAELWRYDPAVLDGLALQHLTCRGLSYHPGTAAAPPPAAVTPGDARRPVSANVPQLPIAAQSAGNTADCTAKLFMPTADGRLIALNPEDGAVCTNFGGGTGQINLWANMPNVEPGAYYSTSPVAVAGRLIVVGGTVLDNVSTDEQSGVIRAFDIDTGQLVWNWDSGNPGVSRPIPPHETYTPNSPNSWAPMSVDPALGMVYVPLGNEPPDQWGGKRSDSVERFSSSIVALDLDTGEVRWSFQTVHHDLWDYDVPAQPSLVDLRVEGESVPALVQPTKQGDIYVLDRRNGEPILPIDEISVPRGAAEGDYAAPTQPVSALTFSPDDLRGRDMWGMTPFDQLACRIQFHRLRYEGRYTPPSTQGTLIHPGNFGVFNWGGIAVDPQRQIAFTTPTYLAFVSKLVPRDDDTTLYVQGKPSEGGLALPALNENFGAPFAVKLSPFTSVLGIPCHEPPWGYVAAADLTTGEVIWQHKNGSVRDLAPVPLPFEVGVPNLGGPIMTAGGVAFLSGTLDYYVRAYDVTTGEQLWNSRLPAGGQATPMTYRGADGRQYLLVVAGGHGSLGTKAGDYVIAYALPES